MPKYLLALDQGTRALVIDYSGKVIAVAQKEFTGGACAKNLLLQTQADLLGVPVVRAANPETTAMGAAYLAGLAVGFYKSTDEVASQWASDRTFEPRIGSDERHSLRAGWNKAWAAPRLG
jgi:glycerol kinase